MWRTWKTFSNFNGTGISGCSWWKKQPGDSTVTFLFPHWRSLQLWKGHLNTLPSQQGHKELPGTCFSMRLHFSMRNKFNDKILMRCFWRFSETSSLPLLLLRDSIVLGDERNFEGIHRSWSDRQATKNTHGKNMWLYDLCKLYWIMNHFFRFSYIENQTTKSRYPPQCQKNFISISKIQAVRGKEHSKFFAAKCWSGGWGYCSKSLRGELSQDSDHWRFTKMAFNAKVFQIEWDSAKPEILSFVC